MQWKAGRKRAKVAVCVLLERTDGAAHQFGEQAGSWMEGTHAPGSGGCWHGYDLGISAILALMALVQVEQVP